MLWVIGIPAIVLLIILAIVISAINDSVADY